MIPDPFEYEDGKQKLLTDEAKKQKLVNLYRSCGFKKDDKDCLKKILILQGPNQESYRAVRDSRTLRSPDSNEDREFVQETTEIKI